MGLKRICEEVNSLIFFQLFFFFMDMILYAALCITLIAFASARSKESKDQHALRFNDEAEQEMDALVEEDTQQLNEEIEDSASEFRDLESKDKDKDIAQPRQALFWGSSSSDSDGEDDKDGEDDQDGDCATLKLICKAKKIGGWIHGAWRKVKNVPGKIIGAWRKAKNFAGKISDAYEYVQEIVGKVQRIVGMIKDELGSSSMSNNTTTPVDNATVPPTPDTFPPEN